MSVLDWLLAPPLVGCVAGGVLYARGSRRHLRVTSAARLGRRKRRDWALYAALATIVTALDSPIDVLAAKLFWVHMVQHVMLMMVAAPLLVLAAPWTPMWRGLSLNVRRGLAAAYVRSPAWRPLRAAGRWVAAPAPAWLLFNADLCAWHVPALYELTLRSQAVHDLEHVSFLVLGVVFWAQVIDSPPLRPRLELPGRVAYVTLGATVAWLVAVVLAFAGSPLYPQYAAMPSRPGGLSALADQQLAAGIMWGPGSIPYALFVFVALYRWLAPGGREEAAAARVNGRRPAAMTPAGSAARSVGRR
jgi:cytochrome c oxidase assembly factor CtaG